MADTEKPKLFREKTLEAIESPEVLNDYLRVTSPGVWIVLATVVILLTGFIVWGVFGRIQTTATLAVLAQDGTAMAYVPYDILETVVDEGSITVKEQTYPLKVDNNVRVTVISADTNPIVCAIGNLGEGDMTVEVSVDAKLDDGVYEGTVVTESLKPMSLLLQ